MESPDFNPNLHPRDLIGRWAHVASGDQAAKKLAMATDSRTRSTVTPGGKPVDPKSPLGRMGVTSIVRAEHMPAQPLNAKTQAAHAEARKFENMDLAWPKRADFERLMDMDAKTNFIKAQYHGALDEGVLNATKEHRVRPETIAEHFGKPLDEVKTVLMHLESQSIVYGNDDAGYYVNRRIGSARTGTTSSFALHKRKAAASKIREMAAEKPSERVARMTEALIASGNSASTADALAAELVSYGLTPREVAARTPSDRTRTLFNQARRVIGERAAPKIREMAASSALPNLPVDVIPLPLVRDVKKVAKEIEATGRTEENSPVRRVINSARSRGDTLFAARNAKGDIVAAAMVDIDKRKRNREFRVHELFKDDDAPPRSGTLLMVEIAKAAKASHAELNVSGALTTARTFYEEMGGDFEGYKQPSGIFTSQSSSCTWSTESRDALAAGRPIPAQHYLIEGPWKKVDDARQWTNTWVEPPGRHTRKT